MFREHTWSNEQFDQNVQAGLDLVRGRVLFLTENDGERTHVIVLYIGWLAMAYLRREDRALVPTEREVMVHIREGARELRIHVGTSPEAVTAAISAFRDK